MNRRQFLRASGWTAGGLTVMSMSGCGLLPVLPTFGGSSESDALAWVKLDAEGQVVFLLPRAEIGQGIDTGLSLVVAEELQQSPASVRCVYQRTDLMAPCQMTVGSQSIENYMTLTAYAAACLRQVLCQRGAQRFGVPVQEVRCRDAHVITGDQRLAFAELLEAEEDEVLVMDHLLADRPAPTLLSQAKSTRYVGHSDTNQNLRDIVTGATRFSRDIVLDGMLFGVVAHPTQLGVSLQSYDRDAALAVPGVVACVEGPQDQVGIVAQTPMAADTALGALSCQWAKLDTQALAAVHQDIDIDELIATDGLDHQPVDQGNLQVGRQQAVTTIEARYDSPMAAHAAMEVRAGVVRPTSAGLEVWTGSQDPWYVRGAVSKATGVNADQVVVHNCRVGGGFGGRVHCQATVEAAWLAMAVQQPVKVQWQREDEFAYNYVGPQFSTRVEAGVDEQGQISFWHHQMAGAPVLTSSMLVPSSLHWLANLPADPGTIRGVQTPYALQNHRVRTADLRLPMPTGPWRGLGAAPNTFAVECAMDELALSAGIDPIEIRIQNAKDPRYARVLQRLAELIAGVPNASRSLLGVAATAYKDVTFVAIAAEVNVSNTGIQVEKIWCVHDCGRMISPDRVRAQIEGNLVWGVSMALLERFELGDGLAATRNFDTYTIARQTDMPELVIDMLDFGDPSTGSAEAALAPAAAAIANGVSRSSGHRRRQLPLAV